MIQACLLVNPDHRCSMNDLIAMPLIAVHSSQRRPTQSGGNGMGRNRLESNGGMMGSGNGSGGGSGTVGGNGTSKVGRGNTHALRTIKNVDAERLLSMRGAKNSKKRTYRHVPQSVPLNNRAQTRLLSPTGVFDRPDNVPLGKRPKFGHLR